MIALPCSTEGTVTPAVERRLRQFALPHPGKMSLGQVQICPLDDADQVAQYVAFAASVATESSEEAISQIGRALGKASRELGAVGSISVPLFGTGAGGLSPADVITWLRRAFQETAASEAVLSIFVLAEDDYRELSRLLEGTANSSATAPASMPADSSGPDSVHLSEPGQSADSTPAPPRVFISHTVLPPERKDWLADLYRFLRANGINARLDAYSLRPGMDLVQWMCNELEQADRVLLICDQRYSDRADRRHGGVGWETMLIQGDLYAATYGSDPQRHDGRSKYLPIVLTPDPDRGKPTYLATKLVFHWPEDADEREKRQALLRELYEVTDEPPIGPRPSFL